MPQKSDQLKAELLSILGSTVYQQWPQIARVALRFVFEASIEERDNLLRTLLLNFGSNKLQRSIHFSGDITMPEDYFLAVSHELTRQGGVADKAINLLRKKLPFDEFFREFMVLLNSLKNISEQSVFLSICVQNNILPYNYVEIDAGISNEYWDYAVEYDQEVISKIISIILNYSGKRYHDPTDRAKALLDLVNQGAPDEKTKIIRMSIAVKDRASIMSMLITAQKRI